MAGGGRRAGRGAAGTNLPAEVTSFVGRRCELAEVKKRLADARLVTLTGVGGVGKTRLAVRLGSALKRAFRDGVWMADLTALHEPELLAHHVAAAVGIRDQSARPSVQTLVERLQGLELLLVLDNCEHLLEECAALVNAILRDAPQIRVLATSRQRLEVAGEHVVVVPPLATMECRPAGATAERVEETAWSGNEALALLTERAAEASSFAVTADNQAVAAQLCQRLDGIPLAIELAAVRLSAISIEEIAERLDDRFTLLTGGRRGTVPHHRTLEATLDWSYGLCALEEQLLWARLAVFSGGFDLPAAEAVCADDRLPHAQVLDLLTSLVHKSIVTVQANPGRARYRLLETVREYGLRRLDLYGETYELRRRHRDHFQEVAVTAGADWFGPHESAWMERIRTELPNLRTALDFCVSEPGEAYAGLVIAVNLTRTRCWYFAGTLGEGRHWLEQTLALTPEPSAGRLSGLALAAWSAQVQGDRTAARAALAEAVEASERLGSGGGDAAADAEIEAARGGLRYVVGAYRLLDEGDARSIPDLIEARDRLRAAGAVGDAHMASLFLGLAYGLLGDPEQIATAGEPCLAEAKEGRAEWSISWGQWAVGIGRLRSGRVAEAERLFRTSLRAQVAIDDQWGPVWLVEALAWAAAAGDGDRRPAARLLGAAERLRQLTGVLITGMRPFADAHARCAAILRADLTVDEYDAAVTAGMTLRADEIIALALGRSGEPPPPDSAPVAPSSSAPSVAAAPAGPLTEREWQVAELVTRGLSNRAISTELMISQRTADSHVQHILTKLGFASRTQIAAWLTAAGRPR